MPKLILLVGPTCSGKTTLEKALNDLGIPSVISYTTRDKRSGEQHAIDYYFLTHAEVKAHEDAGLVIQKVEFAGNCYGSTAGSLKEAFRNSNVAVMVVEPTGVAQFIDYAARTGQFEVVSIYVSGKFQTLCDRLVQRYATDKNARDAYYWERFIQMHQAYREWPSYIAYTDRIAFIDDGDPSNSTHEWALRIVDTHCR